MIECAVLGVGVHGPGIGNWPAARAIFVGEATYARTDDAVAAPGLLPPAERRRATPSTRIALAAAQQALQQAEVDAKDVPAVFGSDSGNPEIIHEICAMLAGGDHEISPTKFHNSVHNAASGYYSIAVASHCAVSSICALDGTAAATLLEAAVQAGSEDTAVLTVCYDLPYPYPLSLARPTEDAWAIALVLAPVNHPRAIAQLQLADVEPQAAETTLPDPVLEAARRGNPAARLLPLLHALVQPRGTRLVLRQGSGRALEVRTR